MSVKQVALQVGRDAGRKRRTIGGGGQGAGEAGCFLPLLCSTLHLSALDQRQPPVTTLQPINDCLGAACSSHHPSFLALTLLPHFCCSPQPARSSQWSTAMALSPSSQHLSCSVFTPLSHTSVAALNRHASANGGPHEERHRHHHVRHVQGVGGEEGGRKECGKASPALTRPLDIAS